MNPQQYYGGQFEGGGNTSQPQKNSFLKNKRALFLTGIALLVIATVVAGALSVTSRDQPTKVMTLIFDKKDANGSYEALGDYMKERTPKEQWATDVTSYTKLFTGFRLERKKVDKERSAVKTYYIYSLTLADTKSTDIATVTITVEKKDKQKEVMKEFEIRRVKK